MLPTSEIVHLVALGGPGGLIDFDAVNVGSLELMGVPFADYKWGLEMRGIL